VRYAVLVKGQLLLSHGVNPVMGLAMPYGRYAVLLKGQLLLSHGVNPRQTLLLIEGQNMCNNGYMDQIFAVSVCFRLGKHVCYETATLSER